MNLQSAQIVKLNFMLVIAAAVTGCTSSGRLRVPTAAEVEAGRRVFCALNPGRCPTPTPVPTAPPCCAAQGGTYSIEVPSPVCGENGRGCWHDPGDDGGCDSCWHFIPLPGATPTPRPTPTPLPGRTCVNAGDCWCFNAEGAYQWCPDPPAPTATPTRTPVVSVTPTPVPLPPIREACMLPGPPWVKGAPSHPVPAASRAFCPSPLLPFVTPGGLRLCVADWPGGPGGSRFGGLVVSFRAGHVTLTDDGYITDGHQGPRPDCLPMKQDAFGRVVCGSVLVEIEGGEPPFGRAGLGNPPPCTEEMPAPPTPGPPPTPSTFPPQPDDFRMGFVNGCDKLGGLKDGCGECDSTYRYRGHITGGKLVQNACDPAHFRCAVEACPGIGPGERQAHIETYEMCGGKAHDSPSGTRLEFQHGHAVSTQLDENPYKHEVCGPPGSSVEIRACLPEGAKTFEGVLIQGGPACGPWKKVSF